MVNGIHNALLPLCASITDCPACWQGDIIKIVLERVESLDKIHPALKEQVDRLLQGACSPLPFGQK